MLIPKSVFNTDIPEDVLDSLKPGFIRKNVIRSWIKSAGLFEPMEKKFSKVGYIVFTSLLYDSVSGFIRGVFPPTKWMREKYNFRYNFCLLYYYPKRIFDLIFHRMPT